MREEIDRHIRSFFSGHLVSEMAWLPGPTAKLWPRLYVLAVAPGPQYSGWVYMTVGAHAVATPPLEFIVCSPRPSDAMAELLAMVVYHHAHDRLGLHHTLPIGRPWLPGSGCDQLLVSLPYPFGPPLENIGTEAGDVQALWLLPITLAERTYPRVHGIEALETLFDEQAINPLDPGRSSVV